MTEEHFRQVDQDLMELNLCKAQINSQNQCEYERLQDRLTGYAPPMIFGFLAGALIVSLISR